MNGGASNLDSTGVISDHIWDLEEDTSVDQMIEGVLNIVFTAVGSYTGGTEGLIVGLRIDDAVGLATAQDGSTAGFCDIAMKHILKEDIVVGRPFSIPFIHDVCARGKYLGAWFKAHTTTFTNGVNITLDAWFEPGPISRHNIQRKNASTGA